MMKKIYIIAFLMTLSTWSVAQVNTPRALTARPDSLMPDPEDEDYITDTVAKFPKNVAEGLNAMDYVLESRHHPHNMRFTKKWDDHLFVDVAFGIEGKMAPSPTFKINPLTTFRASVGKQFNELHAARVNFDMGLGYQKTDNNRFNMYGFSGDYLFNTSSYFFGYDPTRRLETSVFAGVGAQVTDMDGLKSVLSPKLYVGAQLKFFAGRWGYANLEPYFGVTSDKADFSGAINWKPFDLYYGARLGLTHYLRSNLSTEEQEVTYHRYAPWFFEFSNGTNSLYGETLDALCSTDKTINYSVGKWLSSSFGLRATLSSRSSHWNHETGINLQTKFPEFTTDTWRDNYTGFRLDAMINPLGFKDNYNWNSFWGVHGLLGLEVGQLTKYGFEETGVKCFSEAYSIGANGWIRLADHIQLFVEPRFEHFVYRIPYHNTNAAIKFGSDALAINLGIRMLLNNQDEEKIETSFLREFARIEIEHPVMDALRGLTIGVGGGLPMVFSRGYSIISMASIKREDGKLVGVLDKDNTPQYAITGYMSYNFDAVHGVRLACDYASVNTYSESGFSESYLSGDKMITSVDRTGIWYRRYGLLNIAAEYEANLSNAVHYTDETRLFELYGFAGPGLNFLVSDRHSIAMAETTHNESNIVLHDEPNKNMHFSVNLGLKLVCNLNSNLGVALTSTVHGIAGNIYMPGFSVAKVLGLKPYETITLGVQYKL